MLTPVLCGKPAHSWVWSSEFHGGKVEVIRNTWDWVSAVPLLGKLWLYHSCAPLGLSYSKAIRAHPARFSCIASCKCTISGDTAWCSAELLSPPSPPGQTNTLRHMAASGPCPHSPHPGCRDFGTARSPRAPSKAKIWLPAAPAIMAHSPAEILSAPHQPEPHKGHLWDSPAGIPLSQTPRPKPPSAARPSPGPAVSPAPALSCGAG